MHVENVPLFGEIRWSTLELSQALLLTPQRVTELARQHILPPAVDGLYRPIESVASYIRYTRERETARSKAGEAVRKLELENELRQIKLQRLAGTLVEVERVRADWFEAGRRVRDGLLNLPARLSGVFAAESSQEKIFEAFTKEIHQVLTELASGQFPTPATVDKPVGESQRPEPPPNEIGAMGEAGDCDVEAHTDLDREAEHREDRFADGD
ncbi:MAG: hypothetical protein L0H94_01945 [Nitrospira sp.]|nr:hypothetical protein [Nitrospira sp.]